MAFAAEYLGDDDDGYWLKWIEYLAGAANHGCFEVW